MPHSVLDPVYSGCEWKGGVFFRMGMALWEKDTWIGDLSSFCYMQRMREVQPELCGGKEGIPISSLKFLSLAWFCFVGFIFSHSFSLRLSDKWFFFLLWINLHWSKELPIISSAQPVSRITVSSFRWFFCLFVCLHSLPGCPLNSSKTSLTPSWLCVTSLLAICHWGGSRDLVLGMV